MVSQTLTEDFSSLRVLAWEAPQDSWLKGRLREVVWPLDDLARGAGQGVSRKVSSVLFLRYQ